MVFMLGRACETFRAHAARPPDRPNDSPIGQSEPPEPPTALTPRHPALWTAPRGPCNARGRRGSAQPGQRRRILAMLPGKPERTFDRATADIGNIVNLGHININI